MTSSLALHLRPRRIAALALALTLAALAACGGDASDPTSPAPPTARLSEVRVSPSAIQVALGSTTKLSATPRDANGRPMSGVSVSWRSLDPTVASVDAFGNVTAAALGTVRIEARAGTFTDTADVTVRATTPPPSTGVATLSVDPGRMSLRPGTTGTLTAILRNAQNEPATGTVVWTSANEAVARVSASGVVTAVALGEVDVVATVGELTAFVEVTVAEAPPPAAIVARVAVTPNGGSIAVGSELSLVATPQDASGNRVTGRVVTWTSSNAAVATVSAAGAVRGVSAGTAIITARVDNVTQSVTVTVTAAPTTPATSTVTLTPTELGTIERDAEDDWALPYVLLVGDDDEFDVSLRQGFVVYSIAGIPAGAQIQSAQVGVTMHSAGVIGSPFSLGGLYVERATGLALSTAAPAPGAVLVANAFTAAPVMNVTDLVRAARQAGETTIILRFRFTTSGNGNGISDYLELGSGDLSVTYTP